MLNNYYNKKLNINKYLFFKQFFNTNNRENKPILN